MLPKIQMQRRPPSEQGRKPLAVRLINEVMGELELYIAIWGNDDHRDEYGTYFDRAAPPDMALDFLPFPLMYEHGQDELIGKEIIGTIYKVWFDEVGIAARAHLDRTSPHFMRFVQEIAAQELRISSGSAEHVATFDNEGRFVTWYLTEVSLTKYPAESMIPFVKLVRSVNGCVICDYDVADAGRDALSGAIHGNQNLNVYSDSQIRGVPMYTRIFSMRRGGQLVALTKAQAVADLRAYRAVYDEQGNELDPQTALAMLVQDGISPEDLMALLQELVQPMQEAENSDGERDGQPDPLSPVGQPAPAGNNPAQGVNPVDLNAMAMQYFQQEFDDFLAAKQRRSPNAPVVAPRSNGGGQAGTIQLTTAQYQELQRRANNAEGAPPRDTRSTNQPNRGNNGGGTASRNIRVIDRLAGISAPALALGAMILRSQNIEPSDEYVKALLYNAARFVEDGKLSPRDEYAVRAKMPEFGSRDIFGTDIKALRSHVVPTRADEIMNPGQVDDGSGGNTASAWVDDFQGADVWYKLRETPGLYNTLRSKGMEEGEIPAGFKGLQINLEGIDFTFYTTGAAEDWDSGSGSVTPRVVPSRTSNPTITLSVGKLSALAGMAQELIEDSIVPQLQEAQRKLGVQVDEQVEKILINGDTTLTINTNINLSDGTPTTQNYLMFNGLLYAGLVAQSGLDANNTLDEDLFNELYGMLPDEHMDEERVLFLYDKRTMLNARRLPSVLTQDVNSQATIENGRLARIWGVDIHSSSYLKPAHTTGKLTPSTAANHTQGRILLIRPDQMIFAYKRRSSIEVVRDPIADATQVVVHMRAGFKVRDNDAVKAAYDVKTVDSA